MSVLISNNIYMEDHLQELYKKLAEARMKIGNLYSQNPSQELIDLYNDADYSLSESLERYNPEDALQIYVKKHRHFTHLFFAEEMLDNESKFAERATARYVTHRANPPKKGTKANKQDKAKRMIQGEVYAAYDFTLDGGMDDFVQFAKVIINGEMMGNITGVDRPSRSIEVSFKDKDCKVQFNAGESYTIDFVYNEKMYLAYLRTIWLLEQFKQGKFAIFPDPTKLQISCDEYEQMWRAHRHGLDKNSPFDRQQNQAIFSIVNGLHGQVPFILWGPPGTGKTVTIVECIRQLLEKDPSIRILVCTPSNSAADLVAKRILRTGILAPAHMRRYYSLGRNTNDRDRALDNIIVTEDVNAFGLMNKKFGIDSRKKMRDYDIRLMFSTLAGSVHFEDILDKEENFFSHIFIDEASQSLEPETMIPITRYATEQTRIVLCGDHQQLGAVVKANFLKQYNFCSLMERLMTEMRTIAYRDGRTFCQLTDSYRCHPSIIQFSSEHFYENQLRAVMEAERRTFCGWRHLPNASFPLILHVLSQGAETRQQDGRSYHNESEADAVVKYIELIEQMGIQIDNRDIGVISPYKSQVQKIRVRLNNMGYNEITVDSVECYQGSERRVIILSLSRSTDPGFLTEYKRMNTSFTRAKELLIVVMSLSFVERLHSARRDNYWIRFLDYCMANDAITIDKFVGEDGKALTKAEKSQFKQQLERAINARPGMKMERIERKKKADIAKAPNQYLEYREGRDSNNASASSTTSSCPTSSRNSPQPPGPNDESNNSTAAAVATPFISYQNIVPRPLLSAEGARLILKRARERDGQQQQQNGQKAVVEKEDSRRQRAFYSSDSSTDDEDGLEFWSRQFARCPNAAARLSSTLGVQPQSDLSQADFGGGGKRQEPPASPPVYHVNAVMLADESDEVADDGEENNQCCLEVIEGEQEQQDADRECREQLLTMTSLSLQEEAANSTTTTPSSPSTTTIDQYKPPSPAKSAPIHAITATGRPFAAMARLPPPLPPPIVQSVTDFGICSSTPASSVFNKAVGRVPIPLGEVANEAPAAISEKKAQPAGVGKRVALPDQRATGRGGTTPHTQQEQNCNLM